MYSFQGVHTDFDIAGALERNSGRFPVIEVMHIYNNLTRSIWILMNAVRRRSIYPDIGLRANPERFIAISQSLLCNPYLGGRVVGSLFRLVTKDVGLFLGFRQLQEEYKKGQTENCESDPTESQRTSLKTSKNIILAKPYRYFLWILLLGFFALFTRIATEIIWETGWWYRSLSRFYFGLGGRRLAPETSCMLRGLSAVLLCVSCALVVYHVILRFCLI